MTDDDLHDGTNPSGGTREPMATHDDGAGATKSWAAAKAGGSGEGTGDTKDSDDVKPGKKKKKQGSFWKELPVLVGVALVLALIIKTFAVQAFYIPSQSMENTLKIGDRVLVNKIVYHTRDIKRGDIIVFNGTDSWDSGETIDKPTNPVSKAIRAVARTFGFVQGEKDYIKRVIGLPGDTVACCDKQGRMTVNGKPLDEESYLYPGNKPSEPPGFTHTVPKGRLWVQGDHREVSYDSRQHSSDPGGGTIPESRVVGRAFVVVWPVSRWKTLPIPDSFKASGLATANTLLPATPLMMGVVGAMPVAWGRRRWRRRSSPH